jgi:hypothetical protein
MSCLSSLLFSSSSSFLSCCSHFGHRASVKRFVSLQFHDHFTDSRTPWTSDQLVARPLPKHMTTQTQNKHIHIPNIHALCGIRTHDPGFRAKTVHALERSATVTGKLLLGRTNSVTGGSFGLCNFLRMLQYSVRILPRSPFYPMSARLSTNSDTSSSSRLAASRRRKFPEFLTRSRMT